jgi:hypothetical protein
MLARAHLYIADENDRIILSPLHRNDAGIYYEQELRSSCRTPSTPKR